MVEKIEQYGSILKIYTRINNQSLLNYFYTDIKALDLVERYSWRNSLNKARNIENVMRSYGGNWDKHSESFHRAYAFFVLGYYPQYIDHLNGVEIDNVDSNLNVVTNSQNIRNKPSKGYLFKVSSYGVSYFETQLTILGQKIYGTVAYNELDAFQSILELQSQYYSDFNYDFKLDRRNDLDILDLERTGVISQEEATYRHVRRYVDDNPWYVYRYVLEEYCKDNHIVIPNFTLDEQGFMIHPITGQRFCPYI